MRLIDADKLLEMPIRIISKIGGKYPFEALPVKAIELAPTINAAPVRRGEWKWGVKLYDNECIDCYWYCSICHAALKDIVGGDWDDRFNPPKLSYCPNCGAKMNGEESDGQRN